MGHMTASRLVKSLLSLSLAALLSLLILPATPAAADTGKRKVDTATTAKVQKALKKLGFSSIPSGGVDSEEFRNFLCAWRDAVGKKHLRRELLPGEATRILEMKALPKPRRELTTGLNVNLTCQSVAWVVKEKGSPRSYVRVFRASTGAGGFSTSKGLHTIQRRIDGLHNSTSYPSSSGWNMYRPSYFTSWGEAFHGSPSDSSVAWHPTSHGCVRMLQGDIDFLWRSGANAIGTKVYIYGGWQG